MPGRTRSSSIPERRSACPRSATSISSRTSGTTRSSIRTGRRTPDLRRLSTRSPASGSAPPAISRVAPADASRSFRWTSLASAPRFSRWRSGTSARRRQCRRARPAAPPMRRTSRRCLPCAPARAAPLLRIESAVLNYGEVELGFSFAKALVIHNDGNANLTVSVELTTPAGDPDLAHGRRSLNRRASPSRPAIRRWCCARRIRRRT